MKMNKAYDPYKHKLDWVTLTCTGICRNKAEKEKRTFLVMQQMKDIFNFVPLIGDAKYESTCKSIFIHTTKTRTSLQFRGVFFLKYPKEAHSIIEKIFERLYFHVHQNFEILERIGEIKTQRKKESLIEMYKEKKGDLPNWQVTRADVCKDYLNKKPEKIIPIKKDNSGIIKGTPNREWSSNCKTAIYLDKNDLFTGITYTFHLAKLTAYAKMIESELNNNKEKAQLYKDLYRLKDDAEVARLELRQDGSQRCQGYSTYLKQRSLLLIPKKEEIEICIELLERFLHTNKIRVINKKHKNKSRWKLDAKYKRFMQPRKSKK
jgi:hypothetical protein